MKKSLLLIAAGLLAVSSVDAAKVYFSNTKNWDAVYSYAWNPQDSQPFKALPTETIGEHELYVREITGGQTSIIFLNKPSWDGQEQTGNLEVIDGAVYNADDQRIATIENGVYNELDPGDLPATELYLRGTINTWDPQDEYKFTIGDNGLYTLTTSLYQGNFFKIGSSSWSVSYGGPADGNDNDHSSLMKIEAAQEYILTGSNSKNLYVPANLLNVTLTFNLETGELSVSESAGGEEPDFKWFCAWDIDGSLDGSSWKFGNEMESQEEGTYKIHIDCTNSTAETNYFALFYGVSNTTWGDGIRYQPKDSDEDIAVNTDETFPMMQGNQSTWTLGNGNWTVVVDPRDPDNMTISFDLGDSTGEANVLIDRIADTENENTYESYALTAVEGQEGVYTWSGDLYIGDKLKFNIHGVDYYYDPSIGSILSDDADADDVLTIEYPLTSEGNGDVVFDYNSGVTFTIDVPNTKVTADFADAPRVSMYVTNGDESQVIRVVRQNNSRIYQVEYDAQAGDQIDFRLLGTRYECDFSAPASEENGEYVFNLTVPDDEKTAPEFTLEPGTYIFTINANANNATTAADELKTLTVVSKNLSTGVSEIEATSADAVYFNLQGVKIEKPENGLFIEVRGNRTQKVMVK